MTRLLEELSSLEQLSLIDISYSRLNTMFDKDWGCDAKYFYAYVAKEPKQFGAAATLGNVIHKALEENLDPNEPVDLESLLVSYEEQLPLWDPDGAINQDLRAAGYEMLTEFVDRHASDKFPIIAKEYPFAIVVGRGLISGYIDRVDRVGDRIIITDYKSGKKEVAAKNIPSDLQLGIYALAADTMFPGHEIYAQLYYLRTGRQKGHTFSKYDLESVESKLLELISRIISKRDFHPTANERICNWCDFNNGVCPVGTARAAKH